MYISVFVALLLMQPTLVFNRLLKLVILSTNNNVVELKRRARIHLSTTTKICLSPFDSAIDKFLQSCVASSIGFLKCNDNKGHKSRYN